MQPATQSRAPAAGPQRMLGLLGRVADFISSVALFGLMAMGFVDVIGRNLLNKPLPGTIELTELLMATMIFAVLPSISRQNDHVVIDLLDAVVPARFKRAQLAFANSLGVIAFAVICWQVWVEAGKTAKYGVTTPYFEIPLAPTLYVMSVMAALASLGFLAAIFLPTESSR